MVKSEWSLKTIYDVVASMKGVELPDEWVLRGNHHDGWVEGAADPLSGQVALLEEARILGEFAKDGWRPKRTLVYLSWDAEEPGLLGSTEWAEEHAAELKQKTVLYINTDGNERGLSRHRRQPRSRTFRQSGRKRCHRSGNAHERRPNVFAPKSAWMRYRRLRMTPKSWHG